MKKIQSAGMGLILACALLCGQEVIENPENPAGENTGRTVHLKEEVRIEDTGEGFYFRYPRRIKTGPQGSIFVQDQDQLLEFAPDGAFVRNYFKKGQGPGEMQRLSNYFVDEDSLIAHDSRLQKILRFDFEGNLIEEFRIHELNVFARLHLIRNGTCYFFSYGVPSTEGKMKVVQVPYELSAVSEGGEKIDPVISFPVESFVYSMGSSGSMVSMASMKTVPFKGHLAVCHTQEYLVKILDLKSGEVIRSFQRKYKRVKIPEDRPMGGAMVIEGKTHRPPQKFYSDISKLFTPGGHLWVLTSTFDKEKGAGVDVFDFEGRYIDQFYLKIPGETDPVAVMFRPMDIADEYLFRAVSNEDGTYSIVKYRIIDG